MFRVVTDTGPVTIPDDITGQPVTVTPSPIFWLVCDNRNCGAMAHAPADLTSPEKMRDSQRTFIEGAMKDGWAVGMDAHLCPRHRQQLEEAARAQAERGRIVQPVTLEDTVKWNGKDGRYPGVPVLKN